MGEKLRQQLPARFLMVGRRKGFGETTNQIEGKR
jgi:hypothetical protein